jgi:FkbM family methyltransferase
MIAFGKRAARSLRRNLGLPVRIESGLAKGMLFLSSSADDAAFVSGAYESAIQDAIASLLRPGSVFYDVGSNFGFFSLIAARLVGPAGAVVAFEPVPNNVRRIEANAAANKLENITVVPRAVSDKSGVETLYLAEYGGGSALMGSGEPPDVIGETRIEAISLGDFAAGPAVRLPDLVKIDVEGAELRVLHGMRQILALKRTALIIEFDDVELAKFKKKRDDAQRFLTEQAYRSTILENSYRDGGWFVRHLLCQPV